MGYNCVSYSGCLVDNKLGFFSIIDLLVLGLKLLDLLSLRLDRCSVV